MLILQYGCGWNVTYIRLQKVSHRRKQMRTKRILAALLAATRIFTQYNTAAADTPALLPAQTEALREAGRETENILAADAYWNGDVLDTSVFLIQAGDTAQLTVLEAQKGGSWQVAAQNDTLPLSIITSASLSVFSRFTVGDCFTLEMNQYIPAENRKEHVHLQAYRSLDFMRTTEGRWVLCGACDVPFEDAEECRCPYHLLRFSENGWVYRFYEEILDETGWTIDRSEMIFEKTVPDEDLAPYMELSRFNYQAFLESLHTLAPAEYEHAPYSFEYVRPSPNPEKTSDADQSASIYDDSGIPVPESVRDEAHRCIDAGPVYEGCTWIIVGDENAEDPWQEGDWYIIDVHGNRLTDESVSVSLNYFSDGLVTVRKGDKAGCINTEGNTVIPFEYDSVEKFHQGVSIASRDGKYGLISRNNEILLPFEWDQIDEAVLPNGAGFLYRVNRDGKYGFADRNGNLKTPCTLDFTDYLLSSVSWPLLVRNEWGYGYVDQTGAVAIPCLWLQASKEALPGSPRERYLAISIPPEICVLPFPENGGSSDTYAMAWR